ncbi:JAB domain-containing protein, partial [Aquidulcibacter paucihalophilus]|uniref:JAB domain-containing protein n=1 Tax=Aquidulcibacter paucihalophilus TaxID=1978549 RepID=UPI000A193ECE
MGLTNKSNAHLDGHREHLRDRFLRAGADGLADHELLELWLFGVIKRQDTKALARTLLAQFGGINDVLQAPINDLLRVNGVGQVAAIHLKSIHALQVRASQSEITNKPVLGSWSSVLSYLKLNLGGAKREEFRVLFLDKKLRLIVDEKMGEGTVDHAPVYPREIARRALELSASSVILAHNHPSGDPTPSSWTPAITVISATR